VGAKFLTTTEMFPTQLQALRDLLNGKAVYTDHQNLWARVGSLAEKTLGRCHVVGAIESPDKTVLAVCVELRLWLGLKVRHAGFVFNVGSDSIKGSVGIGRREGTYWQQERIVFLERCLGELGTRIKALEGKTTPLTWIVHASGESDLRGAGARSVNDPD